MGNETDPREDGGGLAGWLSGVVAVTAFGALAWAATRLPPDAATLSRMAAERLPESEVENPVTAVLLNFRAFDTLLETAVLMVALGGLWRLTEERDPALPAGNFLTRHPPEPQLSLLLKLMAPLGILTAIYLFWQGSDEPGGAFQAATLLTAIGVLLVVSRALPAPAHGGPAMRSAAAAGFLLFGGIGVLAGLLGDGFLAYPAGWAKPLIVAIEAGLTLSVAAMLFLLASGLPAEEGAER